MTNPIANILGASGTMILDGALATELEGRGLDLNDSLWSAKVLLENPDVIADVHLDYLRAGADCVITSGYQASVPGFVSRGVSEGDALALLQRSVDVAVETRDTFWTSYHNTDHRQRPLVAASIGPYGAFLANGAEYTGDYDLDTAELVDWHRPRWELSVNSRADVLACETIPSAAEAKAYVELLHEFPDKSAWLSFSCKDGEHLCDGTPIRDVAALLTSIDQVVAIGVNCTSPVHISALIANVKAATEKPIVVYPNSGEVYDASTKSWSGTANPEEFATATRDWRQAGANIVGGCCRTTPAHIVATRLLVPQGS